jgi:F-type H+-transporting ATPase subunit b
MKVDLFTLIAQIINFLILVWLLKHFLYDRIVEHMDKREERIKSEMETAKARKQDAEKEAEKYRKKQEDLEEERDELIAEAKQEAEEKKKELLRKGRKEVEQTKSEWYTSIKREKQDFLKDLRERTGKQVYAIVRQVLNDLANEELEQHIINVFIRRLKDIAEEDREAIAKFNREARDLITVKSAFEIPQENREKIRQILKELIENEVELEFEIDQSLISGIELRAGGTKVTWSLNSYLESLEKEWAEEIESREIEEASEEGEENGEK